MKKNITIVDIAREANVSISTVSRVLTGNARVNEEKKQKINEIIKKYDFHPNNLARGLINSKSNTIAILIADIRNPFYSSLFVSCEQAAIEYGYTLVMYNSFGDRLKEFELINKIRDQKVDALILLGGAPDDAVTDLEYTEELKKISENIPIIITGNLEGLNCQKLDIDRKKSISLISNFIKEHKSFKTIAFIGGSNKITSTIELRKGYRDIFKECNLEYIPEFDICNERYDHEGGYDAMKKLLSYGKIPDVVITINDYTAIGAMHAINEFGLKIPDDISLISFDDTYLASIVNPPLTSVSYNYWIFGSKIIESAINLIEKKAEPSDIIIEPKLIVRESCKNN